ncbi:hypothetical protein GCM10023321_06640 [Pseudonocardia eucalypti]|uniref:Uncharacterized protein n=1 Tax=Pseudonocardia eucalypti TaxID=648755 RepID=A0ABP9PHT1_9PSEU
MGAPGKFGLAETLGTVVAVARETAKMRPSESYARLACVVSGEYRRAQRLGVRREVRVRLAVW